MEVRTYAKIIWRYIWLIALIVGVVALYSDYQYYRLKKVPDALRVYSSSISLQIGLLATNNGDLNPSDNVTVAETLADTLVKGPILASTRFCSQVSDQIGRDRAEIERRYGPSPNLGEWQDPGVIGSALSLSRVNSLVTVRVNWRTAAGAWAIANAIGEVSSSRIGQYLDYVIARSSTSSIAGQPAVSARVISPASRARPVASTSTDKLKWLVLQVLVALALGVALAYFLDYLDDRIRSKEDLRDLLNLPIYGEVPRAPPARRRDTSAT